MPSEVTPKVPERPSRRKTSELFPLSGSESGDIKANSEPPTPAGTPNVPTRRPILKAKTMTSFESGMDQESLPKVPLQRPVRRSTTEELNNVMNNTSKELEEIESLISKHNIHNVSRKKVQLLWKRERWPPFIKTGKEVHQITKLLQIPPHSKK